MVFGECESQNRLQRGNDDGDDDDNKNNYAGTMAVTGCNEAAVGDSNSDKNIHRDGW